MFFVFTYFLITSELFTPVTVIKKTPWIGMPEAGLIFYEGIVNYDRMIQIEATLTAHLTVCCSTDHTAVSCSTDHTAVSCSTDCSYLSRDANPVRKMFLFCSSLSLYLSKFWFLEIVCLLGGIGHTPASYPQPLICLNNNSPVLTVYLLN